jgi:hypothetical protein
MMMSQNLLQPAYEADPGCKNAGKSLPAQPFAPAAKLPSIIIKH